MRLFIILLLLVLPISIFAGEKEDLIAQKIYIEQKMNQMNGELSGIVKSYQMQVMTFDNDLKAINHRLYQIELEEKNIKMQEQRQKEEKKK